MTFVLGTSGWQYKSWRTVFYEKIPQHDWLRHYAQFFDTVELNNSFYRLPDRDRFEEWKAETDSDFRFSVKMSRFLTHIKRLNDPEEPVQRFIDHATGLGNKLAVVLMQLPPNLEANSDKLDATLSLFPRTMKVAVEFRHQSWFNDETKTILRRHKVALSLADGGQLDPPLWRTADWGYMRFHAGKAKPNPCYSKPALNKWAAQLADLWPDSKDVFVYFNNDTHACALRNAAQFADSCEQLNRSVTNAPIAREMHLSNER